jgi:PTS system ascorbate-specific IIB component
MRAKFARALVKIRTMKILSVCGMGIGTSVLLKMNAEKVLEAMGVEAEVVATDITKAKVEGISADIVLTTPELVELLEGMPGKIVSIEHVFDLTEIRQKLTAALL